MGEIKENNCFYALWGSIFVGSVHDSKLLLINYWLTAHNWWARVTLRLKNCMANFSEREICGTETRSDSGCSHGCYYSGDTYLTWKFWRNISGFTSGEFEVTRVSSLSCHKSRQPIHWQWYHVQQRNRWFITAGQGSIGFGQRIPGPAVHSQLKI